MLDKYKEIIHIVGGCFCGECKYAKKHTQLGNGITEPPYIVGFLCTKSNLFPLEDGDFCSLGKALKESNSPLLNKENEK